MAGWSIEKLHFEWGGLEGREGEGSDPLSRKQEASGRFEIGRAHV